MTALLEFLAEVSDLLERSGIEYMLTGSLASTYYGEPRATRDVDLVIEADRLALDRFLRAIEDTGWYVSAEAAHSARGSSGMFNIIDVESGMKADLIFRKARPFSREEFSRRSRRTVLGDKGPDVFVVSPEDVILAKLEWTAQAGSQQQYRDALRVAIARKDRLDRNYLSRWAAELGCDALLRTLLEEVERAMP
jgi:hypothetical protein